MQTGQSRAGLILDPELEPSSIDSSNSDLERILLGPELRSSSNKRTQIPFWNCFQLDDWDLVSKSVLIYF